MEQDISFQRIRQVTKTISSYPFKIWGYGEGVGLEALLHADERLGEKIGLEFVSGLMAKWLKAEVPLPYTDHVAPGAALMMLYERTGDPALLERTRALADLIEKLPLTKGGARLHRPDHESFKNFVYVDCMDFDAPFLCGLARVTGEMRYYDLATDCLLGHAHVLWDPQRHLFNHLYDAHSGVVNGAFWGRGNGWAALGMIDALENLPQEHSRFAEIAAMFKQQMEAVTQLQDVSGDWHTVLDHDETYLDGSLAAIFYCALSRGLRGGFLPPEWRAAAARAWLALQARVNEDGILCGVSAASPPGSVDDYAHIPTGGIFPWGQGPLLQALLIGPPDEEMK